MLHAKRNVLSPPVFGAGAHSPYEQALRDPQRTLFLHEKAEHGDAAGPTGARLDVERFLARADDGDDEIVRAVTGPVLDVGCGPGRIVKAAILAGHLALGIDVSPTAVEIAQERGLPVLCRSVFHDLPSEGTWGTAMLIDGNIGIGGDPSALLRRCAELVTQDGTGRILVETHENPHEDRIFEGMVVDDLARASLPFPWAEVGRVALRRYAEFEGLQLVREWAVRGRTFAEYASA